ncbi:MAG: GNAT family N-acetyltransferase [Bacteroidales bacterium]|nr:GNAT family N-acetyltransferase [Bacteroidales bacterium]
MEKVIEAIDRELIKRELTTDKFIGKTRKGDNYIYEISAEDSPFTMREVGRLREISFRIGGGGTGKSIDIDEFDTDRNYPYKQLIVWDKEEQEIIGGYRYILCGMLEPKNLATSELFSFSEKFIDEYLPWTIELGRSFIQPNYQSANLRRKSIFALDNLWDALGALVAKFNNVQYLFGKVTMYTTYNQRARDILLNFLHKYFPDNEQLVTAHQKIECNINNPYIVSLFENLDYKEAYKVLVKELKALGEHIPPLINSYMNLSPSMKVFETSINEGFGGVEETGILIRISDIYPDKIDRHVKPLKQWAETMKPKWWKKRQFFKKRTNR